MLRYLLRRLLLTIPVLLGVATLVFALIHLVPGDPARSMLGEGATEEEIARLQEALGLNRPLPVQYAAFLAGVARGDLGRSFRYGTPVTHEIRDKLVPNDPTCPGRDGCRDPVRHPARYCRRRLSGDRDRSRGDDAGARRYFDAEFLAGPAAGDPLCRPPRMVAGRGDAARWRTSCCPP